MAILSGAYLKDVLELPPSLMDRDLHLLLLPHNWHLLVKEPPDLPVTVPSLAGGASESAPRPVPQTQSGFARRVRANPISLRCFAACSRGRATLWLQVLVAR